ncbi:hypothetical protein QYE76_053065 [Lolium multiflorum]|uniref:Retrotransposon gag domain-containing protein n=1 Tax=Lolium multiflorum TaxID=4521 RepID=A0AAD8SV31_LOLMU|nr:hypothetical protein QYE76_053065 [Lolium multiflorum]
MAEETPVTYEELSGELKKKYDEVKAVLEADLIGSFHRTRSHGIRWKGFTPEGALMEWTCPPRENAPGDHEPSYSPSGPALGTHQGELLLQSRPPLPFALAAPEAPNSSAYVVYKIGGDPSDYQCRTRPRRSRTGSAGLVHALPPNSLHLKQLEERFHEQYHSEASEAGIADLAQVRQKRGETVSEYIQRFRTVRNRCYSVHVSEKEAVELAVVGLSSSIKDVASQADYPSLAHMVQKLSAYEQRHPDVYQDKFKRVVTMVDAGEDEVATGEQEVAVAEWTRAAGPVTCKWVKPPGPPRGFDFDVTKTEQIFDLLLAEKHIKIPEGHKVPTVQELNGKPYCKWHNTFTHTTNDCRVWRQQIQMAIENGRLIFNQYAMKVDTHPFPAVNMVEFAHLRGCQPDFSANISMVELGHRSEKDGDEDSCSQSKDTRGPLHAIGSVKMASATSRRGKLRT